MRHIVNNRLKEALEVSLIFSADFISILAIFKLAVLIRTDSLPRIFSGFPEEFTHGNFLDNWWLFLLWVFFFSYEGLYVKRFSFWDEVKALWKAAIYSVGSIFIIVSLGKLSSEISRTVVLLMGLLAMGIMPVARATLKKGLRRLGFLKRRALILGAGETGRLVMRALKRELNYGYEVLGFIDDDPEIQERKIDGLKIHRGLDKAERYIQRCGIQDVFVAIPERGWEKMKRILNSLQHKAERILFVPGISGIALLGISIQHFFHEQTFALELKNNLSEKFNLFLKRCIDFALSILFVPLFFILIGFIALLIKLDSKGQVIFSQERVGRHGNTFGCLKFRTMYKDTEERLAELLSNNPEARKEWETHWKLKNDPRITRVGRFLRKTSLDELPQIFNVLRGEMSFVGPRPYLLREKSFIKESGLILNVLPGITGLWQVSARSNTSYDLRIALDAWYVRNWNLWLDMVILIKTIKAVFRNEGAW